MGKTDHLAEARAALERITWAAGCTSMQEVKDHLDALIAKRKRKPRIPNRGRWTRDTEDTPVWWLESPGPVQIGVRVAPLCPEVDIVTRGDTMGTVVLDNFIYRDRRRLRDLVRALDLAYRVLDPEHKGALE